MRGWHRGEEAEAAGGVRAAVGRTEGWEGLTHEA